MSSINITTSITHKLKQRYSEKKYQKEQENRERFTKSKTLKKLSSIISCSNQNAEQKSFMKSRKSNNQQTNPMNFNESSIKKIGILNKIHSDKKYNKRNRMIKDDNLNQSNLNSVENEIQKQQNERQQKKRKLSRMNNKFKEKRSEFIVNLIKKSYINNTQNIKIMIKSQKFQVNILKGKMKRTIELNEDQEKHNHINKSHHKTEDSQHKRCSTPASSTPTRRIQSRASSSFGLRKNSIIQVIPTSEEFSSNLLNPNVISKLLKNHQRKQETHNLLQRLKREKEREMYNSTINSIYNSIMNEKKEIIHQHQKNQIPIELGINKISLPARERRKKMLEEQMRTENVNRKNNNIKHERLAQLFKTKQVTYSLKYKHKTEEILQKRLKKNSSSNGIRKDYRFQNEDFTDIVFSPWKTDDQNKIHNEQSKFFQ